MADVQAGSAYIAIRPDLSGFHQAVGREVARALAGVGRETGQRVGRDLIDGVERETVREAPATGEEIGDGITAGIRRAIKSGTQSVRAALDSATTPAAAAAGAAAGVALVGALDVTAARGKLQAQLGLTAAESQRVGKIAGSLFAEGYGESMTDVNSAITSVIRNMDGMRGASASALRETTTRAITTGQVLDEDVGAVTRTVSQLMRTGLAKNAGDAFDLIVAGAQHGANAHGDLLDTLNEYATQFREVGLDAPRALGLISQAARAGAPNLDYAADAVKEFAIRSKDATDDNAIRGFELLGLNAKQMFQAFAAGGPGSDQAFRTVITRLKQMTNPVKQNEAAVALFGTKAEDLGDALYALDPATAVQQLGNLKGATDDAGDAMSNTSQAKFEEFKRSVQANVVDAAMGALPVLERIGSALSSAGVTPAGLATAGIAVGAAAVAWKGLSAAATGAQAAISGVKAVGAGAGKAVGLAKGVPGAWDTLRLRAMYAGDAVRRGATALRTSAAAARASAAAKLAEARASTTSALAAGRQRAAAAGGWVMRQVAAMRLLTAAKLAEARASTASALAAARQRIAAAALLVWQKLVRAATVAWTAVQWLLNAAMSANPLALIVLAIVAVVAAVVLAYKRFSWFRTVVHAVWGAVSSVVSAAWNNVIKPVFNAIKNVLVTVVVGAFRAYWAYLKFVWAAVSTIIRVAWNNVIKPIFNVIKWAIVNVLIAYYRMLWNVVKTVWNGIRSAISTVWNSGIRPVFDKIKAGVNAVKRGFEVGVDGIKRIWDRLQGITKKPVQFFVNTVYTNGIRKVWSGVRKLVPALPDLPSVAFRSGGILPGYTPGRDVHRFFSPSAGWLDLSGGEGILRPEFTRALGSRFVHAGNAAARRGGTAGVAKFLGQAGDPGGVIPGFKNGGIVGFKDGGILGILKKPLDLARNAASPFLTKGADWVARSILEPILTKLNGLSGPGLWAQALTAIPKRLIEGFLSFIKKVVGPNLGGGGSSKAVMAARSQIGVPYSWGGGGPHGPSRGFGRGANTVGFDCSSLMQYAWYQATGKTMPRTTYTQRPFLRKISTPVPGAVGQPHPGHTYMYSGSGRIIEAPYTGANVRETSVRNTPFWGLPPWKYDQGGWLQPGISTVVNATRRPEAVLTDGQLRALTGAATGGGDTHYHAHFDGMTKAAYEQQVRAGIQAEAVLAAQRDRTGRRR